MSPVWRTAPMATRDFSGAFKAIRWPRRRASPRVAAPVDVERVDEPWAFGVAIT